MKTIEDMDFSSLRYKEIRTNKKKTYINLACSFDIETSSVTLGGNNRAGFAYGWSFAIQDDKHVYYGRTLQEFKTLLLELKRLLSLSKDRILVCYVHNLAYEFQFIKKLFSWESVFSQKDRDPIIAMTEWGIEFRDSYILSSRSLESLADNLIHHDIKKLTDSFDYEKMRHEQTPLTDLEKDYMRNDVLIIIYYINEQIAIYGDISKVPLTNTQRVRRYMRDKVYYNHSSHGKSSKGKYLRYRNVMKELTLTEEVYNASKRAFMGGYVHANPEQTNKVHENVASYDFISSYPATMLSEQFPMGKGVDTKLTEEKDLEYYRENYFLIFDIEFTNLLSSTTNENYISESKCTNTKNVLENNGRIFSADKIVTTITDVDMDIIERAYTWDSARVANVIRFRKGYLPKPFVEAVLSLYEDKTALKGVAGKELDYVISKEMLNSTYGMAVTDVVRPKSTYNDETNQWESTEDTPAEQIEQYNSNPQRFLYYIWGVFTTAFARRNLWLAILNIGDDYLYSDTDSIKIKNEKKHLEFIARYNKMIDEKQKQVAKYLDIDYSRFRVKDKYGNVKVAGHWEKDGDYKRFKALGAKIYLVEHNGGSERLEMTVAGLNKKKGIAYLQDTNNSVEAVFKAFSGTMVIPAEHSGKMNHTYIDREKRLQIEDYQGNIHQFTVKSGVHLENASFSLRSWERDTNDVKNLMDGYVDIGMKRVSNQ